MPFETFIPNDDSDYNEGWLLQEYNETLSILAASKPQSGNGTTYLRWVIVQDKDKKPLEKNGKIVTIPMGVRLGSKRNAVNVLRSMLEKLTNCEWKPKDDIPF